MDEVLFSYGTLQQREVQLSLFGRLLEATLDAIEGFREEQVEIHDPGVLDTSGKRYHPIVVPSTDPNDCVRGVTFLITSEELAVADRYQVADYRRVLVRLRSGGVAWAYIQA